MQAVAGRIPATSPPSQALPLPFPIRRLVAPRPMEPDEPMNLRDFRKAGHWPSLVSAFLYFDVSFMIWVLVGALAVSISGSFWPKPDGVTMEEHLRQIAPMKNLMIAVPLLGGSILRLVLGFMTDR